MNKLELIYTCCNSVLIHELSLFWKCFDISPKELSIDSDQLQGILIYVISRMNYPQMLTELSLIEKFLPRAVKKSTRFLYLEMMSAACQFILDTDFKESFQEPGSLETDPIFN